MRRYKLLKDLPTFKAGEKFHINQNGSLVADESKVVAYAYSTLDKFPNILGDWFEEIPEDEPWVPVEGKEYWYVCTFGVFNKTRWDGGTVDFGALKLGNCFKTEEEAKRAIKWLKARKVLMDDTKGFEPDWSDNPLRWYVCYDHDNTGDNPLDYGLRNDGFQDNLIYFENCEDAKESIKKHRAEWLTYFGVEEAEE